GRPEILAQVDEAVQHEFATGVSDILIRRTQLFFRDRNQGLGAAPGVAARLQAILGWDEARCQSEIEAFQAEVALSRRFRSEPKAARADQPSARAEQPSARADQRAARVAE
ncbi:MAG: glycerol-3-phosphate dehydrogenase C-terminal domain-containing protein, partial [Myxococcota bacterium]